MKSVFADTQEGMPSSGTAQKKVPKEMRRMAERFVSTLREQLGENEVRALAADKVASPVLQVCVWQVFFYGSSL